MSMITLQNSSGSEVTILPNWFIDNYMSKTNGEFVKVYIYLVRIFSNAPVSFSLEQMADLLLCTEGDILRALKYWEKENLLTLSRGSDKTITGIVLHTPQAAKAEPVHTENSKAGLTYTDNTHTELTYTDTSRAGLTYTDTSKAGPTYTDTAKSGTIHTNTAKAEPADKETAAASSPASTAASVKKSTLTPDRVKKLKENEEVIQLLYIAEQYLGKTLTPTEIQKILFFYDELKMSADLIDYLIEYCVGRNHKSMRYIETVALSWAQEGITTVKMAKDASSRYGKDYYTILKAMGISSRNPVDTEIALMDTWMKDYGFTMDIIQEACSRTVLQTGQSSFQYADKILTGWKKKAVKSLDDIRVLDAEHKKRKLEKSANRQPTPKTPNRFNNFHQRDYDFEEYEKKLLNQ
ncbi:DnaD domain protein [Blautia schinkii]|nr:DnaD domain protein [Blautia schinkii]